MVSLEGTLDLFALPDVLRLLGGTPGSGALRLADGERTGQVWLAGGRIVWAAARPGPRPLVTRLHRQAGIDPAVLADAVRASGGRGIGRALLDAGAIDQAELAGLLHEHAGDELADLAGWRTGSFRFDAGAEPPETLDHPGELAEALAEAASRRAALDGAAGELGPDVRLAVPPVPPGAVPVTIDAWQWRLLAATGQGATVAELVRSSVSGLGELRTRSTLAAMGAAGLLVVSGQATDQGEALLAGALAAVDPSGTIDQLAQASQRQAGEDQGQDPDQDQGAGAGPDMVQRLVAGVRGL